jgi:hypothetical protein
VGERARQVADGAGAATSLREAAHPKRDPAVITGPLLLWLAVQLFALGLSAFRVPLAAKWPRPQELLATHVLLAAQVSAAALLFPWLMRSWRAAIVVAASAWTFLLIAAVLSATPLDRVAIAGLYVTTWLVTLAVWREALPRTRSQLFGVAVAAFVAIGSALVCYLRLEYTTTADADTPAAFGPITAAIASLRQESPQGSLWIASSILAASGAVVLLVQRAVSASRRKPTASRPAAAAD